jgi:hypothetical protein
MTKIRQELNNLVQIKKYDNSNRNTSNMYPWCHKMIYPESCCTLPCREEGNEGIPLRDEMISSYTPKTGTIHVPVLGPCELGQE